jgi:transcriptional regulator with XRE-family HTH domain
MQQREIGDRIRRLRDAKVWTQEHLAEAAGVWARTVQRAEEGASSAETLSALAAALDVPVQELRGAPLDLRAALPRAHLITRGTSHERSRQAACGD